MEGDNTTRFLKDLTQMEVGDIDLEIKKPGKYSNKGTRMPRARTSSNNVGTASAFDNHNSQSRQPTPRTCHIRRRLTRLSDSSPELEGDEE